MPKPIPKPSRSEDVLAAVAARYPSGATVTLSMMVEVVGVHETTAAQVRRWAAGRMWTVSAVLHPIKSGRSARRD